MPTTHLLTRVFDAHLHLRSGETLKAVLPYTMQYAHCAVVMPNTRPRAILGAEDVELYRDEIVFARNQIDPASKFEPIMTIEIRDTTTPLDVFRASKVGTRAGKVYPAGVTTNSDEGVRDFTSSRLADVFAAMSECGMCLLLHGEIPGDDILITDRERMFIPTLFYLAANFPKLKIVLEHVSTSEGVEAVKKLGPNIAATITLHHLMRTLNDVLSGGTHPHEMCNPVPKGFRDRQALIAAATSGDCKFFLGSDSAPHSKDRKECANGACGVFSAPALLTGLATVFDQAKRLSQLESFAVRNGLEFYGLTMPKEELTLIEEFSYVPAAVGEDRIIPFLANERLPFSLVQ